MNFSSLLNDMVNKSTQASSGNPMAGISKQIPGGLAGGAVAGGLAAMLVSSKSARKTAGTAAKYGGAALLGGLAYKAYNGWKENNAPAAASMPASAGAAIQSYEQEALAHSKGEIPVHLQTTLLKAMIAAARADGQIDQNERSKIMQAVQQMNMDENARNQLLDLFLQPIAISDFVNDLQTLEQKSEAYLASCLVIDLDHETEYQHLSELAKALALPPGLEQQLRAQASNALLETQ